METMSQNIFSWGTIRNYSRGPRFNPKLGSNSDFSFKGVYVYISLCPHVSPYAWFIVNMRYNLTLIPLIHMFNPEVSAKLQGSFMGRLVASKVVLNHLVPENWLPEGTKGFLLPHAS